MIPLIGAVLLAASAFAFWMMLPNGDEIHWLMKMPSIEAYVPVIIISGIAVGVVMLFSVLVN